MLSLAKHLICGVMKLLFNLLFSGHSYQMLRYAQHDKLYRLSDLTVVTIERRLFLTAYFHLPS